MMDKKRKKVEQYIEQYQMIGRGDRIVTGVSGGADSVCLLFVLCELRKKLGFEVIVCHVNHQLRAEAAEQDEAYVKELCRKLDVPCRIFHENVELIAKKRKESLEESYGAMLLRLYAGSPVRIRSQRHIIKMIMQRQYF